MNKENRVETIDDIPRDHNLSENQIQSTNPDTQNEYHNILTDLILLALPSPSQQRH